MNMSVNGSQASNVSTPLHDTQKGPIGIPKNPDAEITLVSQDSENTLLPPGLSVGLPQPPPLTLASTTMAHLGSLGDDQTSADITTFMALFQQLAQQMRNTARTQRSADMQAQVTALQGAAAQMKDAAQSRFIAAMIQGTAQVVGGLAQAGFSMLSARRSLEGISKDAAGRADLNQAKTATPSERSILHKQGLAAMEEGKKFHAYAARHQSFSQASGGVVSGTATLFSTFYTREADEADARRSELEVQARVFETGVQHANDTMQQMMDVIRDVRDKLQSIQQSAIETNRSIARNI